MLARRFALRIFPVFANFLLNAAVGEIELL
jgi:hypothetical protein